MNKKKLIMTVGTVFLFCIVILALVGNPIILKNRYDFGQSVKTIHTETVKLNEIVPFEWDMVYTFNPYMSKQEIEKIIGFKSNHISETVSEGMTQLLFVKGEKVVCSICGYDNNLGYGFSFGAYDGDYLAINKNDNALFAVSNSEGNVYLTYNK